jgi:hypothetical protein
MFISYCRPCGILQHEMANPWVLQVGLCELVTSGVRYRISKVIAAKGDFELVNFLHFLGRLQS